VAAAEPLDVRVLRQQELDPALGPGLRQPDAERDERPRRARQPALERQRGGGVLVNVPDDDRALAAAQAGDGGEQLGVVQQDDVVVPRLLADHRPRGADRR
jgi:hypothetical protein